MKPPKKTALPEGHKLVTRRDFLAHGLISSAAFAVTPTVLGMLIRSEAARAAGACDAGGGSAMPAVLIIDHAGGAGLLGQILPVAGGEQPLTAEGYAKLGLGTSQRPSNVSDNAIIDSSWGIRLHRNLGMSRALATRVANRPALAAAKALTTGFATVSRLGDDTSNNPTNPAAGLAMLGAIGDSDRKLAAILGSDSSSSGGNSAPSVRSPLFTSTQIRDANSAANLVSTGQLATRLGNDRNLASKVMSAMQRMSQGQLSRFSSQDLPTQAAQLVDCGYLKGSAMTGTPQAGLPSVDLTAANPPAGSAAALTRGVFDFNNQIQQRTATMTYLLAMGFSGVATITLGGRDYHNGQGSRGTTDGRDAEAATLTGQAIELYHELVSRPELNASRRPLMIIHITDGGVSAGNAEDATLPGFFPWTSDRGEANAALVFMYDPAGRPQLARNQLGYANAVSGGSEQRDRSVMTPFSNNGVALAEVFMLNYLQLGGKSPGDISKAFATQMTTADYSKYAITAKARG
jgi:hypothetical protein